MTTRISTEVKSPITSALETFASEVKDAEGELKIADLITKAAGVEAVTDTTLIYSPNIQIFCVKNSITADKVGAMAVASFLLLEKSAKAEKALSSTSEYETVEVSPQLLASSSNTGSSDSKAIAGDQQVSESDTDTLYKTPLVTPLVKEDDEKKIKAHKLFIKQVLSYISDKAFRNVLFLTLACNQTKKLSKRSLKSIGKFTNFAMSEDILMTIINTYSQRISRLAAQEGFKDEAAINKFFTMHSSAFSGPSLIIKAFKLVAAVGITNYRVDLTPEIKGKLSITNNQTSMKVEKYYTLLAEKTYDISFSELMVQKDIVFSMAAFEAMGVDIGDWKAGAKAVEDANPVIYKQMVRGINELAKASARGGYSQNLTVIQNYMSSGIQIEMPDTRTNPHGGLNSDDYAGDEQYEGDTDDEKDEESKSSGTRQSSLSSVRPQQGNQASSVPPANPTLPSAAAVPLAPNVL